MVLFSFVFTLVTCLAPEIPDNGFYVADSYLFNSTVDYACNRSFFMSNGSASRTCLNSGDYDGQEPTCSGRFGRRSFGD